LQALIDGMHSGLPITIEAVISNRPGVNGLTRAQKAGVPTRIVDHTGFADRAAFDAALMSAIDAFSPQLLVLAGFMRILTPGFVQHYRGRLLNIHPSLLPKFQGLNTHQRAIDAGETEHGASVHFVTEELDSGQVILQARVPVEATDNAATLAARVLQREHQIYPLVIKWYAEGRLRFDAETAWFDGAPLIQAFDLDELEQSA
jgi:phosphoribosylglycinamide formyltransferase-1